MSQATDDLNAAAVNLQTAAEAIKTAVTTLQTAVANSASANDPAIEAAVATINGVSTDLQAVAASVTTPPAP